MIYRRAIRPLLFTQDPEFAHEKTLEMLALASGLPAGIARAAYTHSRLRSEVAGIAFPNPVGLAAGCDKNGKAIPVWASFGFGFVETGTVTAQPQPGNPKPRVFRLPEQGALINRLGFNSDGSEVVAKRIAKLRRGRKLSTPLGINIGKTKLVSGDDATLDDYRTSFRRLSRLADFVIINVSSPNTPGLREWQEKDKLAILLKMLSEDGIALARKRSEVPVPLFVKISPDMTESAMAEVVEVVFETGITGIIATNTTITREGIAGRGTEKASETGGLSGKPLKSRATEVIRQLSRMTEGKLPLIGVGGIFTAQDAYERIKAGASLVQIYTAMVYEGPLLARKINAGISRTHGARRRKNPE